MTPEKEELVRDLYFNKKMPYHEIAKIARVSVRDIKGALNKGLEDAEKQQAISLSSKAYKLFSEGKSPLDVAIALNLREDKVSEFYKEFWNLKQLHDFNTMYLETTGCLGPFLKLYGLTINAGIKLEHVVRLIKVANNDLPSLEYKYENVRMALNTVEDQIQNSRRKLVELNNQITEGSNCLGHYQSACRKEENKLEDLRQKRIDLEYLVSQFENYNNGYLR